MADAHVTTPMADDSNPAAVVDETKLLEYAVQELPADAVKELITHEVCVRCIFRLFNIHEGVMQFSYRDQRDVLVEKDHAADFATLVAESVKEKYDEIASFTLEVSLPTLITENESVILSYMKEKYASEVWFQEKFSFERIISVKDALKQSITHSLETLLGVKSSVSDFRIRLTYEHVDSTSAENRTGKNQCNKRIKSDNGFCKTYQ
ncbi:putative tRNA pseudouridine synthase Pus10 [Helianthus annuus]|nr:putative tRNA pseudouridine synthase Pus10 [Helianthus annuus]